MNPDTLISIWPFAILASSGFFILVCLGLSSDRSRRLFVPVSPVLAVVALWFFGFFWSADQVQTCSDCASTFAVASLDIVGTRRIGTGVGGQLHPDVLVLFAIAAFAGLLLAARRAPILNRA